MTIQNRGGRYFNQSGLPAQVGIHRLNDPNWFIQGSKDINRQPLTEQQEIHEGEHDETDQNEGISHNDMD